MRVVTLARDYPLMPPVPSGGLREFTPNPTPATTSLQRVLFFVNTIWTFLFTSYRTVCHYPSPLPFFGGSVFLVVDVSGLDYFGVSWDPRRSST